jgi:hypothetical protein
MNHSEVLQGIRELQEAIEGVAIKLSEEDISIRLIAQAGLIIRLFPAAFGITTLLRYANGPREEGLPGKLADHPDLISEIEKMAKLIYDVFRAPGDWGYQTPIGNALRKIYQC